MRIAALNDTLDLWEAWIDLQDTGGISTLYVIGDICTGTSKTVPVLLKKEVQGAAASHLILEVMPCLYNPNPGKGRLAEVGYAEPIADLNKYEQVSICAGEDIIARIQNIEVVQ